MEKKFEATIVYWGYIAIMEEKMEATKKILRRGLVFWAQRLQEG